ncbi:hypothetical protein Scep_004218 [Stephania cephalantha]|uniref:Uncharacterized protein n=1 Tax=Stephania cephalantha TaxID=152367 RepID=A0AAP0PX34_9MAGN
MNSSCQNMSILTSQINASINNLIYEEESPKPIHFDQEEDASVTMLRSVEKDEYLTELKDKLEVFPSKSNVIVTEVQEEEIEMKAKVDLERPYEPYEESKEDQPLMLMNPPPVSLIFVKFETGMEPKGHLRILCSVNSYVLTGQDYMEIYLLEVQYELKTLKESIPITLPKAMVIPFVRNYSKLVGIT